MLLNFHCLDYNNFHYTCIIHCLNYNNFHYTCIIHCLDYNNFHYTCIIHCLNYNNFHYTCIIHCLDYNNFHYTCIIHCLDYNNFYYTCIIQYIVMNVFIIYTFTQLNLHPHFTSSLHDFAASLIVIHTSIKSEPLSIIFMKLLGCDTASIFLSILRGGSLVMWHYHSLY